MTQSRHIDTDNWDRERLLEALDSHTQRLSDSPQVNKWADKSTDCDGVGAMPFVVSTDEVDRHGDTISVDGWRLDAYMRNPVFLWAHNHTRPAIGRTLELRKERHSLVATVEFVPTSFAQEVAALYRSGFQKGVSVGFRPLKYNIRRDAQTGSFLGINFVEQELLEISAAPVPANQSALRKALEGTPLMRSYYYHQGLEEQEAPQLISWNVALREVLAGLENATTPRSR